MHFTVLSNTTISHSYEVATNSFIRSDRAIDSKENDKFHVTFDVAFIQSVKYISNEQETLGLFEFAHFIFL